MRDAAEIGSHNERDGRSEDTDKARIALLCDLQDVIDVLFIAAEYGIVFGETGDIDHAVDIVPARLIVGGKCGIAAGGIVHNDQPAEFIQRRADTGYIGRVIDCVYADIAGVRRGDFRRFRAVVILRFFSANTQAWHPLALI